MVRPAEPRFGSAAFDRMLELAANEADPAKTASALVTLHKIVFIDVLPPEELARVIEVARTRMSSTQAPNVWQAAVELGVATGDPQLRAMVAGIASGAARPAFFDREDLRLWVRNAAQKALGGGGRQATEA